MILLEHNNGKVISIRDLKTHKIIKIRKDSIVRTLFQLSNLFDDFVIWVHQDEKFNLNLENLQDIFHHDKIMASYSIYNYFGPEIGYVNPTSPSITVDKSVNYGTWLMSSIIGGINLKIVKMLSYSIYKNDNFDYFLNSLAYQGMNNVGLICYSEPKLIKNRSINLHKQNLNNIDELFKFVNQHQKTRWIFLLFLNFLIYEKKIPFLSLIKSLFYHKRVLKDSAFNVVEVISTREKALIFDVDVIVPTIGRKSYLIDFLEDLSLQTILPKNVIIVEQNPDINAKTELEFILDKNWPFAINHIFTNQAGACNARNIAIKKLKSKWVFFADDDIRINEDLFEKTFSKINQYSLDAVTVSCLQAGEKKMLFKTIQWPTFGSGASFVRRKSLFDINFDIRYEFGFGEDADFGMQLRKKGIDILYIPDAEILHLKAQIGGFRIKQMFEWENEILKPKPSPTVMLYKLSHNSLQQIRGYKIILLLKYYKIQDIKNLVFYYTNFHKQWDKSIFYAKELTKFEKNGLND